MRHALHYVAPASTLSLTPYPAQLSLSPPHFVLFSPPKRKAFNRMCHISGAGSLAAFWLRAGEMRAGWWGERKSNNFFFFSPK